MPLPPPSFTKSKWLAFFAELTAKLTHHNILVVIEGCEILKRLLMTRISIAALLQEGELLQHLLDTIVGGIRSERLLGPSVALNEELTWTQLETLSLCIDLLVSLHADGDPYYCLLVQARTGAIIEGLVSVLQRVHPHFFGVVANLLMSVLSLPIGRPAPDVGNVTASQSVALRRHIEELRGLVQGQGELLQDVCDTLTAVMTTTQGPQRLASLKLLNVAMKRLRKYRLRHKSGLDYPTSAEKEVYRRGLNDSEARAPAPATASSSALAAGEGDDTEETRITDGYSELNMTLTGVTGPSPPHGTNGTSDAQADDAGGANRDAAGSSPASGTVPAEREAADTTEEDVSAVVDREPAEVACEVPESVVEQVVQALQHVSSHEAFFAAMNQVWCLTVADGAQLASHFTLPYFQSVKRFLVTAPTTRQDRTLFTSLLLWLSHMMASFAVPSPARDALLDVAAQSLIPLLQADAARRELQQRLPQRSSLGGASSLSPSPQKPGTGGDYASINVSSIHHAQTTGLTADASPYSVVGGGAPSEPELLLPYALAKKRAEATLLETPSIAIVVLSFLLNVERCCSPRQVDKWIRCGGVLAVIERSVRRVENVKSVLVDTPTTMDGALSDEVYLADAMRTVQTDDTTVAALACKLLASMLWSHFTALQEFLTVESSALVQTVVPLLLRIGMQNPTLMSATENVTASALYHTPGGPRSSRYTSLGECAVVGLDACLWFTKAAHLHCLDVADLLPAFPGLSRCTRNSIHPPLRATVYRALTHLCETPAQLVLVVTEMPSVINAAVTSVLEYGTSAPQWEAAAAAEWICRVMEIASTDSHVEHNFNFSRTALPIRLLELVASSSLCYASAELLRLSVAVFEQQARFAQFQQEVSHSVLAPYGRRSLNAWFAIIRTATTANEKLAHISEKGSGLAAVPGAGARRRQSTAASKDALVRAISVAESIAVQYSFTCALVRSLYNLLSAFPEHREHFTHHMIYGLLSSVFAAPAPQTVFELLSARFGVAVSYHPTLVQTYQELIQWTCELCPLWFQVGNGVTAADSFAPLPDSLYRGVCRLLADASVPQRTRCHVPLLLSSVLVLPAGNAVDAGLAAHSAALFEASLSLKNLSCVSGMQCRLLRRFGPAAASAVSAGWLAARVLELETLTRVLVENGGVLGVEDWESFLVTLSLVSSVVSNEKCPSLPRELFQPFCSALCEGVRYEQTRLSTLQALKSMATSEEGRRCFLYEIALSGEPLSRTCFGRLLALTLAIPTVWSEQQDRMTTTTTSTAWKASTGLSASTLRASTSTVKPSSSKAAAAAAAVPASSPSLPASRELTRQATVLMGYDVCTTLCGKGGPTFVAALVKHRGVEVLDRLLTQADDHGRGEIPLGLLRLVAALSLHAEAQRSLFQQSTLFTILVERAGEASMQGTLALFVVRNLCFNTRLKTLLCQDTRVLLTLKAALMGQPSVEALVVDQSSAEVGGSSRFVIAVREEVDTLNPSVSNWAKQTARRAQTKAAAATASPGSSSPPPPPQPPSLLSSKVLLTVKGLEEEGSRPVLASSDGGPETFRRQELAVTALWALMYDHQRGKVYVRDVLQMAPSVTLNQLVPERRMQPWQHAPVEKRSATEIVDSPGHNEAMNREEGDGFAQDNAENRPPPHSEQPPWVQRIVEGMEGMRFLGRGAL